MRYHFDFRNGEGVLEDAEGIELDGIEAVRKEAEESAREMIAERIRRSVLFDSRTAFEIRDEHGAVVHVQPFAAIVLSSMTDGAEARPQVALDVPSGVRRVA